MRFLTDGMLSFAATAWLGTLCGAFEIFDGAKRTCSVCEAWDPVFSARRRRMSASLQYRTCQCAAAGSRFVPLADSCTATKNVVQEVIQARTRRFISSRSADETNASVTRHNRNSSLPTRSATKRRGFVWNHPQFWSFSGSGDEWNRHAGSSSQGPPGSLAPGRTLSTGAVSLAASDRT